MQCSRGRARATHRTAALGAVVLLVGTLALGACGSSPRSADEVLASAQAFVADVSAFRFDAHSTTTYVIDADDFGDGEGWGSEPPADEDWPEGEAGSTTTDRAATNGAWTTDGWESRTNSTYGRIEEKVFGTTWYTRDGTSFDPDVWQMYEVPPLSHEELVDQLRSMTEDAEEYSDSDSGSYIEESGVGTGLATSIYLGGQAWGGNELFDDPGGFLQAIADMSDPEVVSRDGVSVTLAVELFAPGDIEEAVGAPLPPGQAALVVGLDGAPESLALSVGEGDDSVELEIEFSDWNVPVEIDRPADDEVDETPWFDEEEVAAVPGIQLLRPTAIPEGWELDAVQAYSASDNPEDCDQVELYWSPMVSEDGGYDSDGYLDVYLLPVDCALESDRTPFEVGEFAPLASRESEYGTEVLVGETVVQIDTTLEGRELAAVIASLAPTDLATLGAEVSGASIILES
jgi:hypothetical protein